jgi:NADP-dependent 3-hydroxy acid dehydrogenase YdfG
MMSAFENQVAVVTGASSGIGKAIVSGLAERGAAVCLLGRSREKLDAVIATVPLLSSKKMGYEVDLGVDKDIRDAAEKIKRDFGRVDMLVYSAGDFSMGEVAHAHIEDLDRQYRINVRAPYLLTQILLPLIKESKGQVVFINSTAGLNARAKVSQYAATKHALKAIADSLREEVNADGVRVLSIFPGRTATPMQAAVHELEGKAYRPELFMRPDDVAIVVMNALSLPRSAEVTDVNIRPLVKPA